MSNIAVVGDKSSVIAFKALGVAVFTPVGAEEARTTVDRLAKEDYGIIFITEEIASEIEPTIERYYHQFVPAIIPIPSSQGHLNIGTDRINKTLEKAVGFKF